MFARGLSLISSRSLSFASSSFSTKASGKVKFFNVKKGYGFIVADKDASDVFVHQSAIVKDGFRSLSVGESVEYDLVEQQGKMSAVNVTGPNGKPVIGAAHSPRFEDGFKPRSNEGRRESRGDGQREYRKRE